MIYSVSKPDKILCGTINLTASKSESNRALIIHALCKKGFEIKNLAPAEDTQTLLHILRQDAEGKNKTASYHVGPAGTTMRFLAAYFSVKPGVRILTGSERMKQRPIKILVDALRQLGAEIEYMEKEGYPPLKITGKALKGKEVTVDASVSSQYITSLLLIAPALPHGIVINYTNKVSSHPYVNMTLKMMEQFGVSGHWHENTISVSHQDYVVDPDNLVYSVEADWSSASYWYALAALSKETDLVITGLKKDSIQGDSVTADLFNFFGVKTEVLDNGVRLTKGSVPTKTFGFDFNDCPDIAQTISVVASALQIPAQLNGLQTLIIKETDRINALINELTKTGVKATRTGEASLEILPAKDPHKPLLPIKTYEDHRMALSFAPLCMVFDEILIEGPDVVKKSYPSFWDDLKSLGFVIRENKSVPDKSTIP